jgi:hypothetical protein
LAALRARKEAKQLTAHFDVAIMGSRGRLEDPSVTARIQSVPEFPVCVSREIMPWQRMDDVSLVLLLGGERIANIPTRKDLRQGNRRLFHLNHRLLIGLICLRETGCKI